MKFSPLVFSLFVFAAVLIKIPHASAETFDKFYTTAAQNDTTAKNVFEWNEKPWIYAKFLSNQAFDKSPGGSITFSQWTWGNSNQGFSDKEEVKFSIANNNEAWFTLSDDSWNNIKRNGQWFVSSIGFLRSQMDPDQIALYDASTTFQLNGDPNNFSLNSAPEPISSTLFLMGGLTMAGSVYRKKRKVVS